MASEHEDIGLAIALFSEVIATEQLIRSNLKRGLPKAMELSHFSVLSHLYNAGEKSPAQLARNFHVTKGAMTNTLQRLEARGFVHIRPDWDDARKKMVAISPAGSTARDMALDDIRPIFEKILGQLGESDIKLTLPILRDLRQALSQT